MTTTVSDIPLTGGTWRPVGGIVRWVPDGTAPTFNPDAIACYCGATITSGCRTKRGYVTQSHEGREPRRCPCSALITEARKRLCRQCAAENAVATKRASRVPVAEREDEADAA